MEDKIKLLKEMAIADGVLSENEKQVFRENIFMTDDEAEEFFKSIEEELESIQSETEVIDWKKKNGIDFEKYVVSKFPANFSIISWTGDKYVAGKYDLHNLDPDIVVGVKTPKTTVTVAIECKFHMGFYKDSVYVAKNAQLKRYAEYQNEKNIPVFIALGVGGSGASPEELYLIPIKALKYPVANRKYLQQFKVKTGCKLYYIVSKKRFRQEA